MSFGQSMKRPSLGSRSCLVFAQLQGEKGGEKKQFFPNHAMLVLGEEESLQSRPHHRPSAAKDSICTPTVLYEYEYM